MTIIVHKTNNLHRELLFHAITT